MGIPGEALQTGKTEVGGARHTRVLSNRGGGEDPRQGHREGTASEASASPGRSRR